VKTLDEGEDQKCSFIKVKTLDEGEDQKCSFMKVKTLNEGEDQKILYVAAEWGRGSIGNPFLVYV
jgi:hypothetical protein